MMMALELATLDKPSGGSVPIITPTWDAPAHVVAFNTTRLGGVSKAPYDSMNLGLHVNDDPSAVRKNRMRLMSTQSIPREPHWLNQVHGCQVLDVSMDGDESLDAADAAFTNIKEKVLCVVTADCLPVVITNSDGSEVAVAHAGWKGLLSGVLQASLEKFSPSSHFHVWLGPAIGPEKFEVGLEVKTAFTQVDSAHASAFVPSRSDSDKTYADIYTLARQIIQRAFESRVASVSITGGDYCTVTEAEYFHSYRRDGATSGRMALVAWLSS